MAAKKYYVVWNGRKTGIFSTWAECEKQTKGFKGVSFKSFPTLEEKQKKPLSKMEIYQNQHPKVLPLKNNLIKHWRRLRKIAFLLMRHVVVILE